MKILLTVLKKHYNIGTIQVQQFENFKTKTTYIYSIHIIYVSLNDKFHYSSIQL